METKKETAIKASLDIHLRVGLTKVISLNLGFVEKVSQVEKIRKTISDNNPNLIVLASYNEMLTASAEFENSQLEKLINHETNEWADSENYNSRLHLYFDCCRYYSGISLYALFKRLKKQFELNAKNWTRIDI